MVYLYQHGSYSSYSGQFQSMPAPGQALHLMTSPHSSPGVLRRLPHHSRFQEDEPQNTWAGKVAVAASKSSVSFSRQSQELEGGEGQTVTERKCCLTADLEVSHTFCVWHVLSGAGTRSFGDLYDVSRPCAATRRKRLSAGGSRSTQREVCPRSMSPPRSSQ